MKKYLILFLVSIFSFTSVSAQWEACNNGISDKHIYRFIVDACNIYAGTNDGVYMSSDNGDSWSDKNKGLNVIKGNGNYTVCSFAINGNSFFSGTTRQGIFLSTNRGDNWIRKSNGLPFTPLGKDTFNFYFVNVFTNSGNNVFVGTDLGVYLSTKQGDNWVKKSNGLPYIIIGLDTFKREIFAILISGNNVFAGTRFGVFKSTDNGNNWIAKNKGIENFTVFSLALKDGNIYAGADNGGVFQSTNDGEDWNYLGLKDCFIDDLILIRNYIFAGGAGSLYISSNNGIDWTTYLNDIGSHCLTINGDYIFSGSDYGNIFRAKLSDFGITNVKENIQKFENYNFYPNPANSTFRLKFNSLVETQVQLSIYDYLGNEILCLSEPCVAGANEKTVDCSRLSTGYYLVKVRCGAGVQTQGLVIIK